VESLTSWMSSPEAWIALATLTALEIVLGIDNIVFISILSGKLPEHQQRTARQGGLALALISRILLLFSISWIVTLTNPIGWLAPLGLHLSGKDLILLVGGLFLVGKATYEIHERLEGEEGHGSAAGRASLAAVLIQILLLDVVFSIDSVITAVGMVRQEWSVIMYLAVIIAVGIMLISAEPVSKFVNQHPTVKMLALAFLILIGVTLVGEAFHYEIGKEVVYGAMAFSVFVEVLNLLARRKRSGQPSVHLRPAYAKEFLEPGTGTVPVPSMVNRLRPVSPVVTRAGGGGGRPRRPKKRR
jgi:predicted tellurium resistance membrane protein TerC